MTEWKITIVMSWYIWWYFCLLQMFEFFMHVCLSLPKYVLFIYCLFCVCGSVFSIHIQSNPVNSKPQQYIRKLVFSQSRQLGTTCWWMSNLFGVNARTLWISELSGVQLNNILAYLCINMFWVLFIVYCVYGSGSLFVRSFNFNLEP